MSAHVDLSDEELNSLTHSILIRYGIDFTCYEPKSLKRRIVRLLNNLELDSVHALWLRFLKDQQFVYTFMTEISVGMTSMFRDPGFWKSMQHILISEYANKSSLKIWHAGCSTGEEVFSMGILLQESRLLGKAKATATDFNQAAIGIAGEGVYHKIKMIENENNYLQFNPKGNFARYYSKEASDCQMNLDLIKHAKLEYNNLITDPAPFPFLYDVIFCRNVMIYFDSKAKENLLQKFYKALKPGGLFVIGFFDTMGHLIDSNQFDLVDDQAKIFRKK